MSQIELYAKQHEYLAAMHTLDAKILRLRMKGMSLADIAKELGISETRADRVLENVKED